MGKTDTKSTKLEHKNTKNQTPQSSADPNARFDRDVLIIHCITMKFSEKESLAYLASRNHKIKRAQYYEDKKRIEDSATHKAYKIAAENGLIEQHMLRISQLETIEREHWQNYHQEKAGLKRSLILEKITALQPYISSAYDYVKQIIKEQAEMQERLARANHAKKPEQTPQVVST